MSETDLEQVLHEVPGVRSGAEAVSRGIHDAVLSGGEPVRVVADVLHGTWLGHPLHPALTDFVVGAWSFGSLLNLMPDKDGNGDHARAAQTLIGMGILAAVPTALAGVTDFSTISKRAISTGATHGILNSAALACFLLSRFVAARRCSLLGARGALYRVRGLYGYLSERSDPVGPTAERRTEHASEKHPDVGLQPPGFARAAQIWRVAAPQRCLFRAAHAALFSGVSGFSCKGAISPKDRTRLLR